MTRQPGWSTPHPDEAASVARLVAETQLSEEALARIRICLAPPSVPIPQARRPAA